MLILYREQVSREADAVEGELKDILLEFARVVVTPAEALRKFGAGHRLPVLTDNERTVSGEGLPGYLVELREFMRDWQAFQGDWCYVDEDGNPC